MSGWTTLPCSSGELIRKEWFVELKAAIDERIDVVYPTLTKPSVVNSGDLLRWDIITEYRDKIERLLRRFYCKTGSGDDTAFTQYSKQTIMEECFGPGVTDWPNKNDRLLRASHWNDMMTVLNKMMWFRISAGWQYPFAAGFTNSGYPVTGPSKAECQDAFDALSDEFFQYNEHLCCGIPRVGYRGPFSGYYYLASYQEWVCRDNHIILSVPIPDGALKDAYLGLNVKNFKGPTEQYGGEMLAPDQSLTISFYQLRPQIHPDING